MVPGILENTAMQIQHGFRDSDTSRSTYILIPLVPSLVNVSDHSLASPVLYDIEIGELVWLFV